MKPIKYLLLAFILFYTTACGSSAIDGFGACGDFKSFANEVVILLNNRDYQRLYNYLTPATKNQIARGSYQFPYLSPEQYFERYMQLNYPELYNVNYGNPITLQSYNFLMDTGNIYISYYDYRGIPRNMQITANQEYCYWYIDL